MAVISMKQLLEAGVHFGHQTRRWNPKMAKYIFTERNGIYIIDLQKTVKKLDEAYNYVKEVAAGMGYDRRIGRAFLDAGLGYGGSCFPKDVKALAFMAHEADLHPQLLEAVMQINQDQRHVVIDKLADELASNGGIAGKTVAVLGCCLGHSLVPSSIRHACLSHR